MPDLDDRAGVTGTARWVAAARARESMRADRLFEDPWAAALAGPEGFRMLTAREPDGRENPFLPVRTRFFDDLVEAAGARVGARAHQVVLLGAGLDTRAYRLRLPARTTVYELDHPEVLMSKMTVLEREVPVCERRAVPADLRTDWSDPLLAAGFDAERPTVWVAEGLFFYLSAAEVSRLLTTAAALSTRAAVLGADTFGTGLLGLPGLQALVANRRSTGAPMPFCTDQPRALLASCGWRPDDVVDVGQPRANYRRLRPIPVPWDGGQQPTMRSYLLVGTRGTAQDG